MSVNAGSKHNRSNEEEQGRYKLKDAVDVNALTADLGTVLEIDPIETFDNALENDRDYAYDCGSSKEYFAMGKGEDGKDIRGSPGEESFRNFAEKMIDVQSDGRVKKRILREGHGPTVPDNSVVKIHYNAFYELGEEPFDSSFVLGKPQKFELCNCVPGLSIAISSMQKQERAQFLVHPQLAYGDLGVPPRIPPNAEILYEIELLSFEEGTIDGVKKKKTFAEVMIAAKLRCVEAKSCFDKLNFYGAQIQYGKAMRMLEKLNLANEEEEVEQEKLLLKVYTNLAACWVKEARPRQACNVCKLALRINPTHVKALFFFGRALLMLQDFKAAQEKLLKAARLKPGDIDIQAELKKVKRKQAESEKNESLFAQKMFPGLR